MIQAKILADSVNPWGDRIITYQVTAPRIILCEINTHLTVSKNTASSRAIPVARRTQNIRENPAVPVWFGANQPGMQASHLHPEEAKAIEIWRHSANQMCDAADEMEKLGIHKGVANRLTESFAHVTLCLTGTEFAWGNWDWLRCSEHADANFDETAGQMLECKLSNKPNLLQPGEWHLPYDMGEEEAMSLTTMGGDLQVHLDLVAQARLIHGTASTLVSPFFTRPEKEDVQKLYATWLRLLVSVSKCGRVSYETQDREYTPEQSVEHVVDKIIRPNHCSPLQHQHQCIDLDWFRKRSIEKIRVLCMPDWSMDYEPIFYDIYQGDFWWGNARNWRQLRKLIRNEVARPSVADQESICADWKVRREQRGYRV